MDVIITAVGEFVWASSCGFVNFCISSGLSVIVIFVSFLCAILASAFYKYTTTREHVLFDDGIDTMAHHLYNNSEKSSGESSTAEDYIESSPLLLEIDESNNVDNDVESLSNIDDCLNDNANDNIQKHEQLSNNILIDSIEGSEEQIQKQQIANIYRLLNDQHLTNNWTTNDFLDQLKMYGLHTYDENELESM